MAIDVANVASVDVEPGTLPETMAAWVIRQEREGQPMDAFQVEEIEVPEPGAFEVIVRVMAAGVNFNNVWAAQGNPVSVFGYGDHPEYGHHIGGSDASGIVWKVGPGVTRWKAGDEVVIHCNQTSYEDPGARGFINRNEFTGMMRTGNETPEEEKERFKVSRSFAKRVKEILGDSPDIVFEHVGKATFPTSVFTVKTFGKVIICGATSGYN